MNHKNIVLVPPRLCVLAFGDLAGLGAECYAFQIMVPGDGAPPLRAEADRGHPQGGTAPPNSPSESRSNCSHRMAPPAMEHGRLRIAPSELS